MPYTTQEVYFDTEADLVEASDWVTDNGDNDAIEVSSGLSPDITPETGDFWYLRLSFETEAKMLEFYSIYDEMWAYDPFPPGLAE